MCSNGYRLFFNITICLIKEEKLYLGQTCHMDELSLSGFFLQSLHWQKHLNIQTTLGFCDIWLSCVQQGHNPAITNPWTHQIMTHISIKSVNSYQDWPEYNFFLENLANIWQSQDLLRCFWQSQSPKRQSLPGLATGRNSTPMVQLAEDLWRPKAPG